jgi:hypothetical protein
MDADGRYIELPARGTFIQGLDVLQDMLEPESARGNPLPSQGEKHERIIGIGECPRLAQGCVVG